MEILNIIRQSFLFLLWSLCMHECFIVTLNTCTHTFMSAGQCSFPTEQALTPINSEAHTLLRFQDKSFSHGKDHGCAIANIHKSE
jgi:hypothetical protein